MRFRLQPELDNRIYMVSFVPPKQRGFGYEGEGTHSELLYTSQHHR